VDPAAGTNRHILRLETPVYLLPIRFTARRGTLDIASCEFTQGDRSSYHLRGIPTFVRMPGDAVSMEKLDNVLQALLAHDLSAARGKPHVRVQMPDMEHHLQTFKGLLDRVAAIPVTLREDEPTPFLLVCIPRLYDGDREYLAGLEDLSARPQLELVAKQQQALLRLSREDCVFEITTSRGQMIALRAHFQREIGRAR